MVSAITRTLKTNNKIVYVSLLSILTFFLLLDYIPGMQAFSAWVTPPLALFLGLAFALVCGQAHRNLIRRLLNICCKFRSRFGVWYESPFSTCPGKEGMEFTVISVIGTLVIGWFIGRKLLKVDRNTSYLIIRVLLFAVVALLLR